MVKIAGCVMVAAATWGFLYAWKESRKQRIDRLYAMAEFYGRAYYALGAEQMQILEFLKNPPVAEERIRDFLLDVADKLFLFVYPTGEAAWEESCLEHRRKLGLLPGQWELLRRSGKAFFGKNPEENQKKFLSYRDQAADFAAEEQKDFQEKKKVFTPVGLLGGLTIVILLV